MADTFDFLLTYAGVPFVTDEGPVVRLALDWSDKPFLSDNAKPPRKHQTDETLLEELLRVTNLHYLQDYALPGYPGRTTGGLAQQAQTGPHPSPDELHISDWYYPVGARRWSVFRGLATSKMVKEMVRQTNGGLTAKTLTMRCVPQGAEQGTRDAYTVSSSMYMLPPRPLFEDGGSDSLDGLFLVTLVDERYNWQYKPFTIHPYHAITWADILDAIAGDLGITLSYEAIAAAAGQPDPDSQLWSNGEDIAFLFEAVAFNVGGWVVRNLDGSYKIQTSAEARTSALASRGPAARVIRTAGGDLFVSGTTLPTGGLQSMRNAVVPATVRVDFPKYVVHNDPVPHYVNTRHSVQRPTAWHEDSVGDVYSVNVPIASGGPLVSGLSGTSMLCLHDTAKALYSGEDSSAPYNQSGLISLAMFVAQSHYEGQAALALDEVYPGTYAWAPAGVHDIVWVYSAARRMAVTRVFRTEWNNIPIEFQHAVVPISGQTTNPRGVGGRSVAQTWRDSWDITVTGRLAADLSSGAFTATFGGVGVVPTQNRWKARIDGEDILFEGTSGGTSVGVAKRGIDGTVQTAHSSGAIYTLHTPQTNYGTNLVTFEKGQFAFPHSATSGGIAEMRVIPQTQTIEVIDNTGAVINGVPHYSGRLWTFDPTVSGGEFLGREYVWAVERNATVPKVSWLYDGQFAGFSASGPVNPIYLINEVSGGITGGDTLTSGSVKWFHLASGAVLSGHLASGAVQSGTLNWNVFVGCMSGILCPGSVMSGHIASGQIGPGHFISGYYLISSGSILSGYIGPGAIQSGALSSGSVCGGFLICSGGINWFNIGSGAVNNNHFGSGVVQNFYNFGAVTWRYITTVTHADLSDTDTTNSIAVYATAAREAIHGGLLKVRTQFTGVGLAGYNVTLSFLGGTITPSYAVNTAPADDNLRRTGFSAAETFLLSDFGGETVYMDAQSFGINLDALTSGEVDLWLCTAVLPAAPP